MSQKLSRYLLFLPVLLLCALLLGGFSLSLRVTHAQTLDLPLLVTYDVQTQVVTAGQTIPLVVHTTEAREVLCTAVITLPVRAVLVFDVSGSMIENDNLIKAQEAGLEFLERMNLEVDQVGIVAFSYAAFTAQPFTNDIVELTSAIQSLEALTLTNIAAGLYESAGQFASLTEAQPTISVIVLLSDGQSDRAAAIQAAAQISAQDIHIYSISLGSNADQYLMEQIATTPTMHYYAPDAASLNDIYRAIQTKIVSALPSTVEVRFEINSAAFVFDAPALAGEQEFAWMLQVANLTQMQTTTMSLVATQPGTHTVFSALQVYYTCPEQTRLSFSTVPTITLSVVPPIHPCTIKPWDNPCLATLPVLGSLTWPCTTLGLPWWMCLLSLLALTLFLILGLWWRRLEVRHQLPESTSAPQSELQLSEGPPRASGTLPFTMPLLLPITASKANPNSHPILVVGLGREGMGVLQALTAASAEITDTFKNLWLLSLTFDSNAAATCTCVLSDEQLQTAFGSYKEQPAALDWLPTAIWEMIRDGKSLSAELLGERLWGRLALFTHYSHISGCFERQLRKIKAVLKDRKLTVYVVAPFSEPQVNGALLDLVYLLRAQLEHAELSATLQGILLTDSLQTITEEEQLLTAAAWRELERVQLLANHFPLTIAYGAKSLSWKVKPFEQCYMFSAQRTLGKPLGEYPLADTLFPTIADFILCQADSKFNRDWSEVAGPLLNTANQLQHQKQAVLYSSLGALTWVLPVEDFIMLSTLQQARSLQQQQLQRGFKDAIAARNHALDALATSNSPNSMLTQLMQTIAEWQTCATDVDKKNFLIRDRLDLSIMLSALPGEQTQEFLRQLDRFAESGILGAQTAWEERATDYQAAIPLFMDKIRNLLKPLPQIEAYRKKCLKEQTQAFDALFSDVLLELLNAPPDAPAGGLQAGLELVRALIPLLEEYKTYLRDTRASKGQDWEVHKEQLEILECELAALPISGGYPHFWNAVSRGLGIACLVMGGLGLATLAAPAMLVPFGLLAAPVVGAGTWDTWRRLRVPEIEKKQRAFREHAQKTTSAAIEFQLYKTWHDIIKAWLKQLSGIEKSLTSWRERAFDSQALHDAFDQQQSATLARLDAQRRLPVRWYPDAEQWQRLDAALVQPLIARDTVCRVLWCKDKAISLRVWGAQAWQLKRPDSHELSLALQDVGAAYATELRKLRLPELLAETEQPDAMARAALDYAAPWIAYEPNAQPDAQQRRMLAVAEPYPRPLFDPLLETLSATALYAHADRMTALSQPYRCSILMVAEHLYRDGLHLWEMLKGPYQNLPRRLRSRAHVLPEEAHAFWLESCLAELVQCSPRPLSPRAGATLRDMRRARAFWLAYAHGWIAPQTRERGGATPWRYWALHLPTDPAPVQLTEPQEPPASLWEAVCAYVLAEAGGPVEQLEAALPPLYFLNADREPEATRAARQTLRQARQQAQQLQAAPDALDQELGLVFQAFLEDTIRLLHDQPMLLEVFL